jgi:hypothetical protein
LYTYVGLFPDSYLARHTQPHLSIPKNVQLADAPDTWWSLVEDVSWEAWVTPHLPSVMPVRIPMKASTESDASRPVETKGRW